MDSDKRNQFMEEITKAKTSEEIAEQIDKLTDLIKNNEDVKNSNEKDVEDEKIEINEKNVVLSIEEKEDVKYDFSEENREEVNDEIKDESKDETNEKSKVVVEEKSNQTFEEMYKKLFGRDIEDAKKEYQEKLAKDKEEYPVTPISNNEISLFDKNEDSTPAYTFVGIAFRTYIILTINDELYIMDQHAAHERIMYEKVKKNYYSQGEKDCQLMLLPDIINLNNKEMGIFRDNKELFEKAGFMAEEFGDNTVKLTGVPEFCLDFDNKEIFLETLDEIDTVARTAKQELENKFLATVACKAAVKAHMALSKEEVDSLMKQLLKLPNPFSCPHGRPTVIKMTKNDIEKKFSRR